MTRLERAWLNRSPWLLCLWPLSVVFGILSALRRWLYRNGIFQHTKLPIPVIVVGNLSVGGNGKTPVVLALAKFLQAQGKRPGIVSRGYGGKCKTFPHLVTAEDKASYVGDEPKLLSELSQCPVVIDPIRARGGERLLAQCDVLICDDGLQHYALARDIEIVVMDERGLGNGQLLPSGPLREGPWRLNTVDYSILNCAAPQRCANRFKCDVRMTLQPRPIQPILADGQVPERFALAIAGIGHPQRFFTTLEDIRIEFEAQRAFADHHAYTENDLPTDKSIIMTQKDAIKCTDFAGKNWCYLPVEATFDNDFLLRIVHDIEKL